MISSIDLESLLFILCFKENFFEIQCSGKIEVSIIGS
jgi:hypothetical protein